jgi:hypothetical protein
MAALSQKIGELAADRIIDPAELRRLALESWPLWRAGEPSLGVVAYCTHGEPIDFGGCETNYWSLFRASDKEVS